MEQSIQEYRLFISTNRTVLKMVDYSSFYRRPIRIDRIQKELPHFDVLVSAFNSSDRVNTIFSDVQADRKIWHIHPEYSYSEIEQPIGWELVRPVSKNETAQVDALMNTLGDLTGKSICVDITGFMRHVLIFLVAKLAQIGVREFTALYSEPMFYKKQEHTAFSTTTSGRVTSIRGISGTTHMQGQDFLLIGVGYDHKLISEVAQNKDGSTIYPIFAFPSLSPDMYQQSAYRASQSGEAALEGKWVSNRKFAPANDPFTTAEVIEEIVQEIDKRSPNANVYLSPLSTKVQTLGFVLYWHYNGRSRGAVSMLMPECTTYARETSEGIKRLWTYTIEL